MPYDNEELLNDLQRVGRELAHVRHGRGRCKAEGDAPEREHGHGHGGPHYPATHGVGSHRNHGGSGRHGQNRILAVLMLADGTSQKDLAYLLGIRPQSLTQALESLEAGGLIERRASEGDARIRQVFLTEAGRGRAQKVAEDRKTYADQELSVLTDEEREQLGVILGKLSAALRGPDAE